MCSNINIVVLGICASLCCFWVCGVPAIILAALAKSKVGGGPADIASGMTLNKVGLALAVVGVVAGCIDLVYWLVYFIVHARSTYYVRVTSS